MNSTEIIIAYEDRLRLSELAGKLADAQWIADNMFIANLPLMIVLGVVLIIFAVGISTMLIDVMDISYRHEYRVRLIIALIAIAIFVLSLYALHEAQVHDVAVIQAEIDEIRRLWGIEEVIL